MNKKILTWIMAIVMSVGLLIQPSKVMAAEEKGLRKWEIDYACFHFENWEEPIFGDSTVSFPDLINDGLEEEAFEILGWEMLGANGWEPYGEPVFIDDGFFRFKVAVSVDESVKDQYVLSPWIFLQFDGDELECVDYEYNADGELEKAIFVSWGYKIVDPDNRIPIKNASIDSDYEQSLGYGKLVSNVIRGTGNLMFSYEWTKKDENGFRYIDGGVFTPGTYRMRIAVRVTIPCDREYQLDPDFELEVNGKKWEKTESPFTFVSEDYTIEVPDLPELQNVNITGDTLSWDPIDGITRYVVWVGWKPAVYDNVTSINLEEFCINNDVNDGTNKVFLIGVDDSSNYITQIFEGEYVTGCGVEPPWLLSPEIYTSDMEIPGYNGPVDRQFNLSCSFEPLIKVSFGEWQVLSGDDWVTYSEEYFRDEGIYRYTVVLETAPDYVDRYKMDPTVFGYIDLVPVHAVNVHYVSDDSEKVDQIIFRSKPYIIKNPSEEPPILEEGHWYEKYGRTYYMLPSGEKATGKQQIGEDFYLFSKNGTLQINVFFEEEGNKYFFGNDGKMRKGWFGRWGAVYYSNEDGAVQTGFVDIEDETYYFDAKGKKTSSIWVDEDGKRYFIKANGCMAKNETISRWGKKYTFDEEGVLIK